MKERSNENSPKIESEMQEICSTCEELRKVHVSLSNKCENYEKQIESQQKIAKLNQVVALLTKQIAEKIVENSILRVENDANKGEKVKENNKEQDVESNSEMENSENSDDINQVFEEAEDEETEEKEQTCAWIISDGKGTSGVCGRVFPSVGGLVAHFNEDHYHTGFPVCSWDGCKRNGEPFKTKSAFKKHLRTHTGERPFRCPFGGCGRSFGDASTLRLHRQRHSSTKYPCMDPECPKVFSNKQAMRRHYRVRHSRERKGFACPVQGCGKEFETDQGLQRHWCTHRAERPYHCNFRGCYGSFASEQSRDEHSRTHPVP